MILIRHGQTEFNRVFSVTRRDPWWPQVEETEEMISHRSQSFRRRVAGEPWSQIGVVTHRGFIRALTGLKVPNRAVLRIDPSRPDHKPQLLFVPDAG